MGWYKSIPIVLQRPISIAFVGQQMCAVDSRGIAAMQSMLVRIISVLIVGCGCIAGAATIAFADEQSISDRVIHYRAVDAVVWGMSLLNFKTFRDGHSLCIDETWQKPTARKTSRAVTQEQLELNPVFIQTQEEPVQ